MYNTFIMNNGTSNDENKKEKTNSIVCTLQKCFMLRILQKNNEQLLSAIEEMQDEIRTKDAIIEELKQLLANRNSTIFASSSEKSQYRFKEGGEEETLDEENGDDCGKQDETNKKRGALPGHKGHGRVIPDNLPSVNIIHELSAEDSTCAICGKAYRKTTLKEISTEIDIKVKIVKKVHERVTYAKECDCEECAELIVASKPEQIIPKSIFSNSSWIHFLVMKYLFQIPINRQLEYLSMSGYAAVPGTIIGGFKKLCIFLEALYLKFVEISRTESHWHADETRWLVFEDKPDKKNHRWWLWTFVSDKVVTFVLDPSRSSKVPDKYFGEEAEGIVNVDRYAAYNILKDRMKKALCWYHLRRDFIKAMEASKDLADWSEKWITIINEVEKINNRRIEFKSEEEKYVDAQKELDTKLQEVFEKCDTELKNQSLKKRQATILNSLKRNWDGYIVFASNSDIPMHNNIAENALRDGALGRKNYYGSHSEWSGMLTAYCMSVFQTVDKHKLNVFSYMEYYFDSCAKIGGVPKNLDEFLPWNISEEIIEKYDMRKKGRYPKPQA